MYITKGTISISLESISFVNDSPLHPFGCLCYPERENQWLYKNILTQLIKKNEIASIRYDSNECVFTLS